MKYSYYVPKKVAEFNGFFLLRYLLELLLQLFTPEIKVSQENKFRPIECGNAEVSAGPFSSSWCELQRSGGTSQRFETVRLRNKEIFVYDLVYFSCVFQPVIAEISLLVGYARSF